MNRLAALALGVALASSPAVALEWETLEPGLELVRPLPSRPPTHGDGQLTLVRASTEHFRVRLLMASELGGGKRTVREWAEQEDLALAVNAGMFEAEGDQTRATFLMRGPGHTNQSRLGKDNAFLLFAPRDDSHPPARLVDRTCEPLERRLREYRGAVQGIRMVSCRGRNTWSVQPKRWSAVALGTDAQGRLLFVFSRSPYRMHDLVERVRGLLPDLRTLMYLEGGPEASLFLRAGGREHSLFGSYETGFNENDDNPAPWPVPNVLGLGRVGVTIGPDRAKEKTP